MSTRLIMLVDDNKIDLFIHSEIIKRMPFEKMVLQFPFAGDALDYLKENKLSKWPDVIILDIHMQIMDGFDFLEEYNKFSNDFREKCKVVMASSSLDAGDLKKVKDSKDVFEFLEKPLDMKKLEKILAPGS